MTLKTLREAKRKAEVFLEKSSLLEKRMVLGEYIKTHLLMIDCREMTDMSQASLDLTRALAELRKP